MRFFFYALREQKNFDFIVSEKRVLPNFQKSKNIWDKDPLKKIFHTFLSIWP